VEINYLIGRLYLDSGHDLAAVAFLIRAIQSPQRDDYQVLTPLAELHLARALRQAGCYAAAAHSLERFLDLAGREIPSYHYDRDLSFVLDELWAVHLAAAEDFARAGAPAAAVPHYRAALAHDPDDIFILSRLAAAEAAGGFPSAARTRALDLVHTQHGAPPAVALLVWVFQQTGVPPAPALSSEVAAGHPRPGVLLALASLEEQAGHAPVAARLLAEYLDEHPTDQTVLQRLMTWARRDGQPAPAFAALVHAVAHDLDQASSYAPQLTALIGAYPTPAILPALTAVNTPASCEAARQYLLGSVAEKVRQFALAEAHYQAALEDQPGFFRRAAELGFSLAPTK
jgi:tetratricopeptide (TPR) repeat protein